MVPGCVDVFIPTLRGRGARARKAAPTTQPPHREEGGDAKGRVESNRDLDVNHNHPEVKQRE